MNLIEQLNLGPSSMMMSYYYETRNDHWRMLHAHQGVELLYVHEGYGSVTVERNTFSLQPGTLICFQPFQLHQVDVPPNRDIPYIRTNITFDPLVVERFLQPFPKLLTFVQTLRKGSLSRQVFQLGSTTAYPSLLKEYHLLAGADEERLQDEDRILFMITLLRHLMLHVFPQDTEVQSEHRDTARHIDKMMDWVENRFHEPFELKRMSDELHLSPHHICHVFKQTTGNTLSDAITARRVREACMLLSTTDKSVNEIGKLVGGLSPSYFCQMFKKNKGLSPQEYRKIVRKTYENK
ncbi:helix-turn-helix domain-containing protein [Paenibacillus tarimensis]